VDGIPVYTFAMALKIGASNNDAMMAMIRQLQSRDSTVRNHEAAHIGAGGGVITGGAHYTYQKGPDGRNYAIGGEVGIDASPISGNPQATLSKMALVKAAALAPGEPSSADQSVATAATQIEAQARVEAYKKNQEKLVPEPGTTLDITL
jgi:hypothetical protein